MNSHDSTFAKTATSPDCKSIKTWFLKPFKKVVLDLGVYFLLNTIIVYCLLFFTTDTIVAIIGSVWVGIIAWRGGIIAGILGTCVIPISVSVAVSMPFHGIIPMKYYFDNKVPSVVMGISQCIITAIVVGYISTLVHRLRAAISLKMKVQGELERKIAELNSFGHMVAHDLKNPLLMIYSAAASLMRESSFSDNANVIRKLTFINDGTKQMIDIIESILLLAGVKNIDSKEFDLFSVSESVDEALRRMDHKIKSNNIQVSKPDSWPAAFGYAPWITEVWVNYIDNAIKYGENPALKAKPVITLGYDNHEETENVRFWVRDNGEGIAKDKVGTLFTEFSRLHAGCKKGYGLGLSIAKSVVEKFNGAVGVETEPGKGSLFYFTLPTKRPERN